MNTDNLKNETPADAKPVLSAVKIGRKEYPIKKGDYILYNEVVNGGLPLNKEHRCYEKGHSFYLVCEIDNGRSKYGDHKCSRCGYIEPFQYDYGTW